MGPEKNERGKQSGAEGHGGGAVRSSASDFVSDFVKNILLFCETSGKMRDGNINSGRVW